MTSYRKLTGILCLMLLNISGFLFSSKAQNISKAEYFVDSDPGFNNGIPIPITPGVDVTTSFQVPLSSFSTGFHHLFVRSYVEPFTVMEGSSSVTKGGWSLTSVRNFYKEDVIFPPGSTPPNIVRGEFFIDADPGFGNGQAIPVTPGPDLTNLSFVVDISSIADGFHQLFARFMDANGKWSLNTNRVMYKQAFTQVDNPVINIVAGEYFIDTDPGFGNGTIIPISPATDINNLNFEVNINAIPSGFHNLFTRFRDFPGQWSLAANRSFYKEEISLPSDLNVNIVKLEYFLDSDPGFGNGVNVPFFPGKDVTVNFLIDLTGQPIGNHIVYTRAMDANGKWSLVHNAPVNVCTPATLSATHTNQSNCNTNDGSVNLTVTGGSGPFTFLWSNGATTQNLTGLAPGTYTVTVTDAQPCPSILTVIIEPAVVINLNKDSVNTNCGNNNGSAAITVTGGGTAPYTYLWSNGATTNNISSLNAGTYTVTVTDINSCQASRDFYIQPSSGATKPVLTVTPPVDPCTNNVTLISSTVAGSYLWTTGDTTQNISAATSGTYGVTISENGCTASESVDVVVSPGNQTTLNYSATPGFINSLVSPASASPASLFRFEVRYANAGGLLPVTANPRLLLDFEGNGSFDDPNDRLFIMQEVNPNDLDVTDGKDYYFIAAALPESPTWMTTIMVADQGGCTTVMGPFNGPVVSTAPDISIFANDISFSDPKPEINSQVTVYATIHNNSGKDANNFTVHLVNQFQASIVYPDIVVPHLSGIPGFNTMQVSWVITTPPQPAWCPMQVFIDYGNALAEPNELDNQAIRPFTNGKFTLPGDIKITAEVNPSPAIVGTPITVSGIANYRNTAFVLTDPSCAGATVTATLVETGQVSSGYTNANGDYYISLTAPVTSGTYHVSLNITDYTLDGDTITTFVAQVIDVVQPCVGPDLVTSITLSPGSISNGEYYNTTVIVAGDSLTGTATVTNGGQIQAGVSKLRVDRPGSTPMIFPIPVLAPGQSHTVNLPFMTFDIAGFTYISAYADYNNDVNECSETNNASSRNILVMPALPDIVPESYEPFNAYQCEFNTIGFTIRNAGGVATGSFNTRLTVMYNAVLVKVFNQTVSNIDPLQKTGVTFNFDPADLPLALGSYSFALQCDTPGQVTELNENNNAVTVLGNIQQCFPDLTVMGCGSMDVKPIDPASPGNITIYATIANYGKLATSGSFTVDFTVAGTHYTTEVNDIINPQASKQVSITVPAPAHGNNQLIVTTDISNTIVESSDLNNSSTASLCWDFELTNIACSSIGIRFIEPTQYVGRPVKLQTGLFNLGLYESSHVQVKFEVSGPGITGWLDLGNVTSFADNTCVCPIPLVLPGQFAFPQLGSYQVRITADFGSQYVECNEANNQMIVPVTVTNTPDYFIKSEYIAPSLLNPDVNEAVTFDITFTNNGEGNANTFELYTQADNSPHDSISVQGVLGGKTNTVHINKPWSSAIRGVHVIKAVVDHDNEVVETDELNNDATRSIVVGLSPNLKFDTLTVSNAQPAPGSPVNISAKIKNNGYTGIYAVYQLFYLDNSNAEVLIRQQNIAVDSAGSIQLTTPWVVTDPKTTLLARIINPNPIEYDATDNEASVEIGKMISTVSSKDASCAASSDGIAKAGIVGGIAPYVKLWSDGHTGDSIFVAPGKYAVTITDAEGTSISDTAIIGAGLPQVVSFSGLVSAYYADDAAVTLTGIPAGGVFSGPGITGNQFIPANAGIGGPYTITYTYTTPEGCIGVATQATNVTAPLNNVYYADPDNDGFGDPANSVTAPTPPAGYVTNNTDNCPTVSNPGQEDTDNDGIGDACDVNNTVTINPQSWNIVLCPSAGFGMKYTATGTFNAGNVFTAQLSDANGSFANPVTIGSTASTVSGTIQCDFASNQPAGTQYRIRVISSDPAVTSPDNGTDIEIRENTVYYRDNDGDGYGNLDDAIAICVAVPGYVLIGGDCNDNNSAVHPGVLEICDGIDNDCNGQIDEGVKNTYYLDADGDGFGNVGITIQSCLQPNGYVADNTDCDDGNANIYPAAVSVTISGNPGNTICAGVSVTFTAVPVNGGSTPVYQWKKNGNNVGTNSATYTDALLANGDLVTCEITSNAVCATNTTASSNSMLMNVNPLPIVSIGSYGPLETTSAAITLSGSPIGGNFSGPGVSGDTFNPLTAGVGNHTITYSYFDETTSCSNTATTTITVTVPCFFTVDTLAGPGNACPFVGASPLNATYSIAATSASSYAWSLPAGATLVSGTLGAASIQVHFASTFVSGTISVTVTSLCGGPTTRSQLITRAVPTAPTAITGTLNACPFIGTGTPVTYSIAPVAGASTYRWTLPTTVTLLSASSDSTSITITFNTGFNAGTNKSLRVKSVSGCGNSADRVLAISVAKPATPAAITGPKNACMFIGTAGEATYYTRLVTNATSYAWTVPAGAIITSHPNGPGALDTIITVSFNNSFVSGTVISVQSVSGCGLSTARNLTIDRTLAATPGVIKGLTDACPLMGTGLTTTYTIRKVKNALFYNWTVPAGATATHPNNPGAEDTSIVVTYDNTFVSGPITVNAGNGCSNSLNRSLTIKRNVTPTPGVITGAADPCQYVGVSDITYTIRKVLNATSYTWSAPAGATISGHPGGSGVNDTIITVTYTNAFTSGNVSVSASNNCATSIVRNLAVSNKVPATPGVITGPKDPCPFIGLSSVTYTIRKVTNATAYEWSVPAGATIVSHPGGAGVNDTIITVNFTTAINNENISVVARNNCATSLPRNLALVKKLPGVPGAITTTIVKATCPNRQYFYSIASLPANATSVNWIIPAGGTVISQGTLNVIIEYGSSAVNDTLRVIGVNNCTVSAERKLSVKVTACAPVVNTVKQVSTAKPDLVVPKEMTLKVFPNPSTNQFTMQFTSTSTEKAMLRLVDISGRKVFERVVVPGGNISFGNDLRPGIYIAQVIQGSKTKTVKIIKQ